MTAIGRLYDYGFDRESPVWDWRGVDGILFGDEVLTAGKLNPEALLRMVGEQFNLPLQNIWRVHVLNNNQVELNDFTLPSSSGRIRETFLQENLPQWVQDSLSVLMIVDQGVTVEGVGKKINDSIFYLLETPEIGEIYGDKT